MNLFQKLQLQSDLIEEWVDSLSFIEVASLYFMNQLPVEIAVNYFEKVQIPQDGLSCGTKYSDVIRGKYPCRQISSSIVPLAEDENSEYYAIKFDPVFYRRNGKIFVLPPTTAEEFAHVNKIPTNFIPDFEDETIENIPKVPENAEHIILLYAAYLVLWKRLRDSRNNSMEYVGKYQEMIDRFNQLMPTKITFEEFAYEEEKPTLPQLNFETESFIVDISDIAVVEEELDFFLNLDLDYDLSDLNDLEIDIEDDINAIDTTISDPAFIIDFYDWASKEFPEIEAFPELPTLDMSSASLALENARGFIGEWDSKQVPQGAFWNDDEDPEMVQSTVQLASQEVNRANGIANTELFKVQLYTSNIDAIVAKFKAQSDVIISEVQARTADIGGRVSVFTAKMDGRIKEVEAKVAALRMKLEAIQGVFQIKAQKAQIEVQYKTSFNQNKIQELEAKIARYNSVIQKVVQRETIKLQAYQASLQEKLQINQQMLENFAQEYAEYSGEFQIRINEYGTNIGNRFQKLQADLGVATSTLQPAQVVSTQFEVENSLYSKIISEAQALYQKYDNEFDKFLGIYGRPKPDRAG